MTLQTQQFRLPDLGEGLTEAALVQWLVTVGDLVTVDQAIAEVETAKSIVELPTPFAGLITALHGTPGDLIPVGDLVLEVAADAVPSEDSSASADMTAGAEDTTEIETYREEERAGSGNVLIGYGTSGHSTPARRRRSARAAATSRSAATTTAVPAVASAVVPAAAVVPATAPATTAGAAPQSGAHAVAVRSPLIRRLARDLGLDVTTITGTGPGGVITRADVVGAAGGAPAAVASTAAVPGSAAVPDGLQIVGREPFSMLRRAVSAKMSASRAEIPEATVWVDVDATMLWELRPQMARGDERPPSLTALVARFVLLALAEYPLLAAQLGPSRDELITFDGINLGIAADTDRGLMVPHIPRADALSVRELDAQLRALTETARAGRTAPERLRGSTFTLNNYGSLGVDGSAAIINHPEVAILGIGRMIEKPWVVDGAIVPRRIAQLSLVFDHRVCDGGYAAGFLRHVAGSIENPLSQFAQL
ncbi:dihydrolipoamide acetyltransferase family protein [Microbacterium sp. ASV49]|uniref:Dihydrolipoamide acetyltransferase component of pyruvate dehydrogenase complex n=1 Tax=Microbacterium candidum TaxID=3041922 RepID=A0ABT7MW65_9MICO|nr:dihydrolipoamide acetyltransferase family protein [Microbacterium sp. ASV49]MDL9978696.1 dihydrolipoamide acetyltransferase family protein [Microbacterium sp. ASV49]